MRRLRHDELHLLRPLVELTAKEPGQEAADPERILAFWPDLIENGMACCLVSESEEGEIQAAGIFGLAPSHCTWDVIAYKAWWASKPGCGPMVPGLMLRQALAWARDSGATRFCLPVPVESDQKWPGFRPVEVHHYRDL